MVENISSLSTEIKEATKIIESTDNNIEINKIVEDVIKKVTNAEYASIWIYENQNLIRERSKDDICIISMNGKKGLLYQCFVKKEAGIYNYLTSEKGYISEIDNPDNIRIKSKIMIPIMDGDSFLGIVTAYATIKKIKKFTNEDLELFKAILPFIQKSIYLRKSNTTGNISNLGHEETIIENNLKKIEESRLEEESIQEIPDYISNIVHDIRTPANGLLGFLDILQEQIKDVRLQEYVSHARNSASLINDLTTSLLDGAAASKSEFKVLNTTKFFSDIADIFSANMAKKNISYNIFVDPLLPKEIELDEMKLKRVIMNLIGNANKFTPEHGCIEFSVRYKEKEKKLHFYVKDNGIGIAKDKQSDIFESFQQAEDNTKDLYGGTGLGLAICASYVKEMGGKLLIDSELDEGSTFYFDLPMEIKDYAKKFTPIEDSSVNITLLISEENICTTNHVVRYLVKMGVNVDSIKAVSSLDQIPENTTHLISFENKLKGDTFIHVKRNNLKLMVIEEIFLSLDKENLDGAHLISKYSYMGEALYTFLIDNKIPRVLIVEDDHITVSLLKTILRDEYCQIDIAQNGKEGLEMLNKATKSKIPYQIVYTDQNMPEMSGDKMVIEYFKTNKRDEKSPTIVSISGDSKKEDNGDLFDLYVNKPFKKDYIVKAFLDANKK